MRALIFITMLVSIQFPFTDLRNFIETETGLLGRPNWPSAVPHKDFVRSFGIIRRRPRGGISGWIGENIVCDANRAIRFEETPTYTISSDKKRLFRVAFKRFFFDGLATGKLNIGLSLINSGHKLNRYENRELFENLLSTTVKIPTIENEFIFTPLWKAGRPLANLYQISSISTSEIECQKKWWVKSITPIIVLIHYHNEGLSIPYPGHQLPFNFKGFSLSNHYIKINNSNLILWSIKIHDHLNEREGVIRSLRICLSRLYAEYSSLLNVLQSIGTEKIVLIPRSEASQMLQLYLNRTINIISKNEDKLQDLDEAKAINIAREAIDLSEPGHRDTLLRTMEKVKIQLKKYDIRLNILRKVNDFINSNIHIQNLGSIYMGDKNINKGQAGSIGRNSKAENFTQIWKNHSNEINLKKLSQELSSLRTELKKRASKPEEDLIVGDIANAEIEANKGNGSKVIEYLSKGGNWVLKTAKDLGLSLVTEILKKSMGI